MQVKWEISISVKILCSWTGDWASWLQWDLRFDYLIGNQADLGIEWLGDLK